MAEVSSKTLKSCFNFAISAWASATENPSPFSPVGRVHTTYYRREFELEPAPARFAELSLGLPRDQPAVAWLNGREVARVERSKREHKWLVLRGPRADPTAAPILMHFWLPAGLLQTGANVLAIEVQRDPAQGGDPGFDAELTAYPQPGPEP